MLNTMSRHVRHGVPSLAIGCGLLFAIVGCDSRDPVPVVITLRDSLVGEGKVAVFSNQTLNRLTVSVVLENSALSERKTGNLDLDSNGTAEFGWLEGWRFVSGETVIVSHPNNRTKSFFVP